MRVFIGVDPRAPVAYNVLQWSIVRRSTRPVTIVPLILPQLPLTRRGLTDFTYSRYLPPRLCGYHGISVFLDSDMLVLGDINELAQYVDTCSVYVRAFTGDMEFERPSVMVFNNEKCHKLTPEYIDDEANHPQSFDWADFGVGVLPDEWNVLSGYDKPVDDPKLIHYTAGIPHFPEMRDCPYAELWHQEFESMTGCVSWLELMGGSKHEQYMLQLVNERRERWHSIHTAT